MIVSAPGPVIGWAHRFRLGRAAGHFYFHCLLRTSTNPQDALELRLFRRCYRGARAGLEPSSERSEIPIALALPQGLDARAMARARVVLEPGP